MARLENWSICNSVDPIEDRYRSPEQLNGYSFPRLQGDVYDDPRFNDGQWIVTSRLLCFNLTSAQTRNTHYQLGTPDPKFLQFLAEHDKKLSDYLGWRA